MHISEQKLEFVEQEQVFSFSEKYDNGLQFVANVFCENDQFLDYQKDLLHDFIAEFLDYLKVEVYDLDEIKSEFEIALQNLNTKLKLFADKVRDVDHFSLKGYMQIVADNTLIASMIGDVNLMIFRDNSLFYSLHNGVDHKTKIDLFSDFVEGDLEMSDEIIFVGTKISDVLDDNDLSDLEEVLAGGESIVVFLEELLTSRMHKEHLAFINHYLVEHIGLRSRFVPETSIKGSKRGSKIKKELMANKYYLTIVILGVVILFMLYHVLSQVLNKNSSDVFVTEAGVEVDITIDDIKKDIMLFQSLDPTSDEKGVKYYEIMQKLDILESKGRWLEDVAQLKTILQSDYHK